MRTALAGVAAVLVFMVMGCQMPLPQYSRNPMLMQQMNQMDQPGGMERGNRIDADKAKTIKLGVTSKSDIEMSFGKAETVITVDAIDNDIGKKTFTDWGCAESWGYSYMAQIHTGRMIKANSSIGGEVLMATDHLGVAFNKDGKVCYWSFSRSMYAMHDPKGMMFRPFDESKAKAIKNGVQAKDDIQAWLGDPVSKGFGQSPDHPKGCEGEEWRYSQMIAEPGKSASGMKNLEVKFNEQGKVCYSKMGTIDFGSSRKSISN